MQGGGACDMAAPATGDETLFGLWVSFPGVALLL